MDNIIIPAFAWKKPEQFEKNIDFSNERVIWQIEYHGYKKITIYDFGYIINIHHVCIENYQCNIWCLKSEYGEHDRKFKIAFLSFLNQTKVFKIDSLAYLCDKKEGEKEKAVLVISGPHQTESGLLYYEVLYGNQKQHVSPCMLVGE